MLRIVIEKEFFNAKEGTFEDVPEEVLEFEHSLVSLSKWESKYQKSFLSSQDKTREESFDYMYCMLITPDVSQETLYKLSDKNIREIQAYIESTQSATTFGMMPPSHGPSEIITSELIYYWMIAYQIPHEFETWHLNRLFSLIRICNLKNSKPKAIPKHELAARNRRLNEERKARMGTRG